MEPTISRQHQILRLVKARRKSTIKELAERLGVSTATIRRDLRRIPPDQSIVQTINGGVEYRGTSVDSTAVERAGERIHEKIRIAERVAEMVQNYDDILVGPGSTALLVGRVLSGRTDVQFRLVTNQVALALETAEVANIDTVLLGGGLHQNQTLGYDQHHDYLDSCNNNHRLILSVDGVDTLYGLTTFHAEFVATTRKMIAASREVILVADSSKLGQVFFATVADIQTANILITDRDAPGEIVSAIRSAGPIVELA